MKRVFITLICIGIDTLLLMGMESSYSVDREETLAGMYKIGDLAENIRICCCGKEFNLSEEIRTHINNEHWRSVAINRISKNYYCCTLCVKIFTAMNQMLLHGPEHTGEVLYRCIECQKRFSNLIQAKLHIKAHQNKQSRRRIAIPTNGLLRIQEEEYGGYDSYVRGNSSSPQSGYAPIYQKNGNGDVNLDEQADEVNNEREKLPLDARHKRQRRIDSQSSQIYLEESRSSALLEEIEGDLQRGDASLAGSSSICQTNDNSDVNLDEESEVCGETGKDSDYSEEAQRSFESQYKVMVQLSDQNNAIMTSMGPYKDILSLYTAENFDVTFAAMIRTCVCRRKAPFQNNEELRSHAQRFHRSGDLKRPYKCSASCSTKWATIESLLIHFNSHTDELKFKCSICKDRIIEDRDVRIHASMHKGNIQAGEYLYGFASWSNNAEKVCPGCPYRNVFASMWDILKHVKETHLE